MVAEKETSEEGITVERRQKSGLVKRRRQLSGRCPQKEVKFQRLDIESYFLTYLLNYSLAHLLTYLGVLSAVTELIVL